MHLDRGAIDLFFFSDLPIPKIVVLRSHLPVHLYQTSPLLSQIFHGDSLMRSSRCVENGVIF